MKLKVGFEGLDAVRRALRAPERTFAPTGMLSEFERIGKALEKGIEVDLAEVELRDGLFVYEDHHVVLYIKDHTMRPDVVTDPREGNRVHLTDCRTLDGMKKRNRFQRYVATARKDDLYDVTILDRSDVAKNQEHSLVPCHNCLTRLSYQEYSYAEQARKRRIVDDFTLTEFFDEFASNFAEKPRHTAGSMGIAYYSPGFAKTSERLRARAMWRCQDCGVDLSSAHNLLDAHHVNGDKTDDSEGNLRALCKLCHATQPNHHHMKVPKAQRRTIDQLRRRQSRAS